MLSVVAVVMSSGAVVYGWLGRYGDVSDTVVEWGGGKKRSIGLHVIVTLGFH